MNHRERFDNIGKNMTIETEQLIKEIDKALRDAEIILEQAKRSLKGIKDEATCSKAHNLANDCSLLNLLIFDGVRHSARLLGELS